MSLTILRAIGAARGAVDTDALQEACRRGDVGAALSAVEPSIAALSSTLTGSRQDKAVSARESTGLAETMASAVEAGASAVEMCVLDRGFTGSVKVDAAIKEEDAAKFRKALDRLPLAVRNKLSEVGIKVEYHAGRMPVDGYKSSKYAGLYSSRTRTIYVSHKGSTGFASSPAHTLRHEVSHALDDWLGQPANSGRWLTENGLFQSAFDADLDGFMSKKGSSIMTYYASDPKEAFAEAGAALLSPKRTGYAKLYESIFPNVTAFVRESLRVRGMLP